MLALLDIPEDRIMVVRTASSCLVQPAELLSISASESISLGAVAVYHWHNSGCSMYLQEEREV